MPLVVHLHAERQVGSPQQLEACDTTPLPDDALAVAMLRLA